VRRSPTTQDEYRGITLGRRPWRARRSGDEQSGGELGGPGHAEADRHLLDVLAMVPPAALASVASFTSRHMPGYSCWCIASDVRESVCERP